VQQACAVAGPELGEQVQESVTWTTMVLSALV